MHYKKCRRIILEMIKAGDISEKQKLEILEKILQELRKQINAEVVKS